jgi:hypothetical protein
LDGESILRDLAHIPERSLRDTEAAHSASAEPPISEGTPAVDDMRRLLGKRGSAP